MRIAKDDIPIKIDVPGATARQPENFGYSTGYSPIGGKYFSLAEGTDIAPLLQGLGSENTAEPPARKDEWIGSSRDSNSWR